VDSEIRSESVSPTEAIKPQNFFNRLKGVYVSPRQAFQEIGRSPRVLIPIIALIVIGLLLGYLITAKVDVQAVAAEQLEQLVAQGRITQEQFDQLKERMTSTPRWRSVVSFPFQLVLMALIIAGIAKLVSGVFLNAGNRFKAILSVTLFAAIAVLLVERALFVLILFLKNPAELNASGINSLLASNLGAWIGSILGEDALPKFLMRLARWVDIFAIWKIALLAIGYSAVSQKLKTATAATWLAVAYGIIALISIAVGSLFGLG
jgi:hypothetical protein